MDWTLEVVLLPVSDIERAIAFYRDQVGFELDHDTVTEDVHIAQFTPPGSGCSIVVGDLPAHREMAPGSMRGLQLVVADAQVARDELIGRGVEASESRSSTLGTAARCSGSATRTATPGRSSSSGSAATSRASLARHATDQVRDGSAGERHREAGGD